MSDWTTLAANSPFVVSVTSSCRRVPSRWPSLRRSHSTRAVGNSALMNPIAMSRESVPCGCQQPPKETLKASGIVQRARVSAERAATCSVSASKHRLGDLGELAVARALL